MKHNHEVQEFYLYQNINLHLNTTLTSFRFQILYSTTVNTILLYSTSVHPGNHGNAFLFMSSEQQFKGIKSCIHGNN